MSRILRALIARPTQDEYTLRHRGFCIHNPLIAKLPASQYDKVILVAPTLSIIIIGAGPGGICTGIQLQKAGITDFTILEAAPGIGGTWWHNRYPGAECDVPSHLYSFSFEPKRDWTRPYARQPEILGYMQHCVDKYDLMPHIELNTRVDSARWQQEDRHWSLTLSNGNTRQSKFLISGVGMFCDPSWPDVPGIDTFEGTSFHTGDWKDGHDLRGEHVAVIGTAASAVQMLPEIVDDVASLTVYQRTPQWVTPKEDAPYSEEQLKHFEEDPDALNHSRAHIRSGLETFITFSDQEILRKAQAAGLRNLEIVEDPSTRRKLTPDWDFGCRRPLSSNTFYPVFNQEHVTLVTDAVETIAPDGVKAGGQVNRADTIIYATGFATTRYLSVIDVYGEDGQSIHDAWVDGAVAYLGITTTGFPNLFMLYGPNTNNGSILEMIEHQVGYIVDHITRCFGQGIEVLSLKRERMQDYNQSLQQDLDNVQMSNLIVVEEVQRRQVLKYVF